VTPDATLWTFYSSLNVLRDSNRCETCLNQVISCIWLFENIVVPNWAYTYGTKIGGEQHNTKKYEEDHYVDDELHEKLLKLVTADIKHPVTKKRNTKKNNNNINNKGGTKKNK
jgi:hypothetical protein